MLIKGSFLGVDWKCQDKGFHYFISEFVGHGLIGISKTRPVLCDQGSLTFFNKTYGGGRTFFSQETGNGDAKGAGDRPERGDLSLIHISEPTRLGMISYA